MFSHYVYKKPHVRLLVGLYDLAGTLVMRKRAGEVRDPKHICFIALHQIGDIVMCQPTMDAIAKLYPEAKIQLVIGKGPASLVTNNPWNAEVHVFDALWQKVVRQLGEYKNEQEALAASKNEFLDLMHELNPDIAIVFHPDMEINRLLGQANIPCTIGFSNAGAGFRLTHPVTMPQAGHQVERNSALAQTFAKLFGKKVSAVQPPKLLVPQSNVYEVKALLKQEKVDADALVVLHPFASAETKNWLPERWLEVMEWLKQHKLHPVIIGGPNDTMNLPSGVTSLCGKVSLPQTAALLSLAKLCIGVDSGPAHIASAVGCPVISIYSSVNDPTRWAPYGDTNKTIILHKPVSDRATWPYEMRDLPQSITGNPYSDKITAEDVIQAAKKLLTLSEKSK